jgi:hypothetical protein
MPTAPGARDQRRRPAAAAGGLFLRRVRPARVAAHLLRRPGRARRRPHQERVRPRHSAHRHRPVLRPGLLSAAARSTGWQREEYLQTDVNQLPMQPAIGANGEPVVVEIAYPRRRHPRQGLAREGGPHATCCCSTRTWKGNAPEDRELTSRLYGGDGAHPHPPGAAAGRGRLPRAQGHGHLARRAAPERRPQRLCRARGHPQPHGGRRHRLQRRRQPDSARSDLHHAHARARRPRPLQPT